MIISNSNKKNDNDMQQFKESKWFLIRYSICLENKQMIFSITVSKTNFSYEKTITAKQRTISFQYYQIKYTIFVINFIAVWVQVQININQLQIKFHKMPISRNKWAQSNDHLNKQIRIKEKLNLLQRQMSILIRDPIFFGNPQKYQRRLQNIRFLQKQLLLLDYQSTSSPNLLIIQDFKNARNLIQKMCLQKRGPYRRQNKDINKKPDKKPQQKPDEKPKKSDKNPSEQNQQGQQSHIKPGPIDQPQKKSKQQQEQQRITYKQITLLSQSDLKLSDFKKFYAQPVIQFKDQTLMTPKQKPLLALGYAYLQFLAETQNKSLISAFKNIILNCQFGVYRKQQITEIIQNQNDFKTLIIKILRQILETKIFMNFCAIMMWRQCMILYSEKIKQYEPLSNQNLLKRFAQCFALKAEADIQTENFRLIGGQNQYIDFHQGEKQFIIRIHHNLGNYDEEQGDSDEQV